MSKPALPPDLRALCQRRGIALSYRDMAGAERITGIDTALALLRADGVLIDHPDHAKEVLRAARATECALPSCLVVEALTRSSHHLGLGVKDWDLAFENGTVPVDEYSTSGVVEGGMLQLPPLPPGVHALWIEDQGVDRRTIVIAAPKTAPWQERKVWGVTGALYGLLSKDGHGLGTYQDMGEWGAALGGQGAAFFGINPIHALGFYEDEITSPYSPSHRGFLNANHLAVGRAAVPPTLGDLVDYATILPRQRQALKHAFAEFEGSALSPERAAFQTFAQDEEADVATFAKFECLSDRYGTDHRCWPDHAWDDPVGEQELCFHIWLQWQAEQQLDEAQNRAKAGGLTLGLYLDLAVGARRGGAEDYLNQHVMAQGVSIGAPGDHLAPGGQNWNLCGYSPAKLAEDDYHAFRTILRASFAHAGMVRIDHVLGLARSFWIPDDGSPGGYIAHNFEAMLALVALEASHANTVVVGEDLGLVPEGFREATAARGLYGYSALQYERDDNGKLSDGRNLRSQSLACFSTHDTPTVEGFRTGRDIDWWEKLAWVTPMDAAEARETRTEDVAHVVGQPNAKAVDFRTAVHKKLAHSPAQMVAVQLDDLLGHVEAQNLPGTINEHPNWQRRYGIKSDEVADCDAVKETTRLMKTAGR